MRHSFLRLAVLASPIALAACSGSSGGTSIPSPTAIPGSYDMLFVSSTPTADPSMPGPTGPSVNPVSPGAHARLDLRKGTGSAPLDAVVTSDWGAPAGLAAKVVGRTLVLTGYFSVGAPNTSYGSTSDSWKELDLDLNDSGGLAGTFHGVGATQQNDGDVVFEQPFSGSGTLGSDKIAPELRASGQSSGPPMAILPWDAIGVQAREPVEVDTLQGKSQLQNGSKPIGLTFAPVYVDTSNGDTSWVGAASVSATLATWEGAPGNATFSIAAGLLDPSGNASASYATPIAILDVGKKVGTFTFDSTDVTTPGTWGQAKTITGGACDVGGCMELGPTSPSPCDMTAHGVAGRLDATGKSNVVIRYRVRIGDSMYGPMGKPITGMPAMQVAVHGLGVAQATTASAPVPDALTDLGMGGALRWQSDWLTQFVPVPAGATEIGFQISPWAGYGCGGGPAPIPQVTDLLIDSVTVE